MDFKRALLAVLGLFLLAGIGFAAVNIFFMSQNMDNIVEESGTTDTIACQQSLSSVSSPMSQEDTAEIPESCFSDGEVLSPELEGASPGDKFRKTRTGVELAN